VGKGTGRGDLSRTKWARDLIFVGDQNDTLDALCELIQINLQYSEYMAHLLDQLCGVNGSSGFPRIDYGNHPYRPIDVEKPQELTGFCYLLVSMKNFGTTYIGQTLHWPQITADSVSNAEAVGSVGFCLWV
jgi:hypothetical protein